jgi:hypothetical protein
MGNIDKEKGMVVDSGAVESNLHREEINFSEKLL